MKFEFDGENFIIWGLAYATFYFIYRFIEDCKILIKFLMEKSKE